MGKDGEGKFHPTKGKPSDNSKEDEPGLRPDLENFDAKIDKEITEKYTDGENQLAGNVHRQQDQPESL